MSELIRCARAIAGGEERRDFAFVTSGERITDAGNFAEVRARNPQAPTRAFPEDRLILPGFVNGHSHAYQILLRGWGDDQSFERWRSDALYRVIPKLEPDDVYWVFVAAFSEMLAAGITTVAEFFYLNGRGNEHARAAIRAAETTGIRLVFARTWMDAPQAPEAFRESIAQAGERTRMLREEFSNVNMCIAPHSLHGASEEMLRAAAAFATEEGCDLHVHVAETVTEVELSRNLYGAPPIVVLERLGVLTERTVAVHAIHVTEEEESLLAEHRVRLVRCPSTNLYLGDGIAPLSALRAKGVTVGLGTDANVNPSLFEEMRLASYGEKAARRDGAALEARTAFALGAAEGGSALNLPVGDLRPGAFSDFLVVDGGGIDPWSPAINALVYRGVPSWIQAAFVGGKRTYTGAPSELAREARAEVARVARRCV